MIIETERLKIVPGLKNILQAAIAGNEFLAKELGTAVDEEWTEFGKAPVEYALQMMAEDQNQDKWWSYLPILKSENKLIGSGGFKGAPTPEGTVEIGYEIAPAYRGHGYATEFAQALISHAFAQDNIKSVLAHTLAYENHSTSILAKCGFVKVDELIDPDDGPIWKWALMRKEE